jgi:hypothetical protein
MPAVSREVADKVSAAWEAQTNLRHESPRCGTLWVAESPKRASDLGGAEGSRTPDLVPAEHALYQLSYSPRIDRF